MAPLFRSAGRKFNPGVPEILTETAVVSRELGYEKRVLGGVKIGWITREPGPPAHFSLYDEDANLVGRCKHCLIAIGHGPLAFPGVYGEARNNPETADRVVQAYEPKEYHEGGRYIIVGSGIAAANEWVNCVDAGAQCVALRRNPHPDEQDLNVPRCLFDGSGIDAFQGLSFDQRIDFIGQVLRGTAPSRRNWGAKIKQGSEDGRFEEFIGNVNDHPARPCRPQRRPPAVQVGGDADDGRDRHRLHDGLRQVSVLAAAPAAAGPDLRRPGAPRADRAEDQLRRARRSTAPTRAWR